MICYTETWTDKPKGLQEQRKKLHLNKNLCVLLVLVTEAKRDKSLHCCINACFYFQILLHSSLIYDAIKDDKKS